MKNENKCGCHALVGIKCDVKNCVYHSGECSCVAEKINVGPASAECSADTVCSTFKPKAE